MIIIAHVLSLSHKHERSVANFFWLATATIETAAAICSQLL